MHNAGVSVLAALSGLCALVTSAFYCIAMLAPLTTTPPVPPNPHAIARVLQIGDASGIQSPLSFGGFGALTRHLGRLTAALTDALASDALSKADLGLINGYNPGLSSAWMLQRAMTGSRAPDGSGPAPDLINRYDMLG